MKSMRSKFAALLVILMSFPISALGDDKETVNPRIVPTGSRIGIVYKAVSYTHLTLPTICSV